MAERIVSPGVFTRENDLSFLAQGVGEIGAAFIGPFKQGPAFIPTIVRTQSEFEDIFGTPDGTYYTEYAVQNYLREAGTATIVRVGGIGGYQQVAPVAIVASGSQGGFQKAIGILFNASTSVGQQNSGFPSGSMSVTQSANSSSFTFNGPSNFTFSSDLLPSSTQDISDVLGSSPFGTKYGYAYHYFEHYASQSLSNAPYGLRVVELPTQDFLYDISHATTPYIISQKIDGVPYNLFRFHTIGDGTIYNTKYKIGISGVKAAGEDGSTDFSVFTVTIRSFSDSDRRKTVLETFNNVNLDPSSPNYIARAIGDRYVTIDDDGKITENGNYSNRSKYIRVEVAEEAVNLVSNSLPNGALKASSP
jgi:hypothetical protein